MQISVPILNTFDAPKPSGDLRAASEEMEVRFLTEMFKIAGLGKAPDAFGGGEGEEHFASLLAEEQARQVVKAGGIGLSETIFNSLVERAK